MANEPPYANPLVRWCGEGWRETSPYPTIKVGKAPHPTSTSELNYTLTPIIPIIEDTVSKRVGRRRICFTGKRSRKF